MMHLNNVTVSARTLHVFAFHISFYFKVLARALQAIYSAKINLYSDSIRQTTGAQINDHKTYESSLIWRHHCVPHKTVDPLLG